MTIHKIINEKLYNLAVKDDESFLVDGIVVHNCRSKLVAIFSGEGYTPNWDYGIKPAKGFSQYQEQEE